MSAALLEDWPNVAKKGHKKGKVNVGCGWVGGTVAHQWKKADFREGLKQKKLCYIINMKTKKKIQYGSGSGCSTFGELTNMDCIPDVNVSQYNCITILLYHNVNVSQYNCITM